LLRIEMAFAFGADLGIDDVDIVLEFYRAGRALEFAGAARGALGRDDLEGHCLVSSCLKRT
jgi:hypothetical protein